MTATPIFVNIMKQLSETNSHYLLLATSQEMHAHVQDNRTLRHEIYF